MIFAQLTKQTGLRSLENSFKAESDLYHAGIKGNISRATLSYANNHRDSKVFEDFYFRLLDYYKKLVDPSLMKSEGKNLKLIDANIMNRNALDIAKIYKKRWTIELFFKCIKQNLRIKKFYGLSEKAVKTQNWIALIVYMLFLILKAEYRDNKRTFSNFCSEIGVRLFKHEKLQSWFCFKFSEKSKPEKSTFLEFDFG